MSINCSKVSKTAAPLSHCGQGLSCLGSVASPMPWGPAQAEGHGCHFPFSRFDQEQMPARIPGAHRGHQYSWSHRLPQTGAAFNSTYIEDSQYTSTNCKLPFSSSAGRSRRWQVQAHTWHPSGSQAHMCLSLAPALKPHAAHSPHPQWDGEEN